MRTIRTLIKLYSLFLIAYTANAETRSADILLHDKRSPLRDVKVIEMGENNIRIRIDEGSVEQSIPWQSIHKIHLHELIPSPTFLNLIQYHLLDRWNQLSSDNQQDLADWFNDSNNLKEFGDPYESIITFESLITINENDSLNETLMLVLTESYNSLELYPNSYDILSNYQNTKKHTYPSNEFFLQLAIAAIKTNKIAEAYQWAHFAQERIPRSNDPYLINISQFIQQLPPLPIHE